MQFISDLCQSCVSKIRWKINQLAFIVVYSMKFKKKQYHNLSISCQLDLFDKVVKPIVLYGSKLDSDINR
jgi:hypothetical protein